MLTVVNMGCDAPIHYPDGGYDYPKKINDTDNYYYPLKDSMPRNRALSPYHYLYPFFNEPNLSLRPQKEDVFRFFFFLALSSLL